MNTLFVLTSEEGIHAIPWASRVAAAAGRRLILLCALKDAQSTLQEVNSSGENDSSLVRLALEAVESGIAPGAQVVDCRGPSVYRSVLDAARELDAFCMVLYASIGDSQDSARATVLRLARAAPYDTFILDPGGVDVALRILVPQLGGGGAHAIQSAVRFFGATERPIVAIADASARSRSVRVFRKAQDRAGERGAGMLQKTSESPIDEALRGMLTPGDLVLLDADEAKRIPKLLSKLEALRKEQQGSVFAVGVTRAEDAAGPGSLERAVERFRRHAPVLTRDQRQGLHQTLEQGGRFSTDFVVMLSLSAAIAALGLIQSSASVVIGAMLVAPLMTPLVAIGMALAQGNARLFRVALHAMSLGIVGALAVSMIVGLCSPWDDLSAEVVARGAPNVFDLGIALLSGMAASFALARPGLAGTLVGVAIAVALLPPLAAVGIATVKGDLHIAFGAAVLFSTNLLAIVVGSAIVFRLFGVDPSVRGSKTPRWVRTTLLVVGLGILATAAVLVQNLHTQTTEGVQRAYARPLAPSLRESIHARVSKAPGVEIVFMTQSNIEHGFGLEIALASPGPIDQSLVADLRTIVRDAVGADRQVRILTLQSAPVIEEGAGG